MHVKKITVRESLLKPPVSEKFRSGCVVLRKDEEVGAHVTDNREEVLLILDGIATVECEGKTETVEAPSFIYIPKNSRHNVTNTSTKDLRYVYVVVPV